MMSHFGSTGEQTEACDWLCAPLWSAGVSEPDQPSALLPQLPGRRGVLALRTGLRLCAVAVKTPGTSSVGVASPSQTRLLPEVASREALQARREGAVERGLAALGGGLHQQQGRDAQQRPQHRKPAVHVASQLGPDHARVETEGRHTRTWGGDPEGQVIAQRTKDLRNHGDQLLLVWLRPQSDHRTGESLECSDPSITCEDLCVCVCVRTSESPGQLSREEHVGQLALPVALQRAVGPPAEEQVVKVDVSW